MLGQKFSTPTSLSNPAFQVKEGITNVRFLKMTYAFHKFILVYGGYVDIKNLKKITSTMTS